ncbi:HPr kinase/phosphorylase [Aureimonas leprariae]|uniref:HPr kinase/phosphorylase C-terminal domain-containing protein n=1 Tax=Plantimonas leprariae TaxID=2615207 RepID=A0A7V7PT69_9HYPH|nr:hypothetical protein [Aureimonas leprariae]KAB0682885.1 hypothetical protein F6X38_02050 [Aureimonas leprariae]
MSEGAPNHHGTAIAVGEAGILIRGSARSGKSSLAFAALRRAELLGVPAFLVADDQVLLDRVGERVRARAPASIRGLIEVSGVGILPEPTVDEVVLTLLVDLAEPAAIERLPASGSATLLGLTLRRVVLPARQAPFGADILQGIAMRPNAAALTKS